MQTSFGVLVTANIGHEARGAKRRRAGVASVVAKKSVSEDGLYTLPSSKLHMSFKGAISHLEYQEILKVEASAVVTRFKTAQQSADVGETPSLNKAVKGLRAALAKREFEVSESTCWTHLQKAIDNNFVDVSPQKPGGSTLPSHLEKKAAVVVRNLRAKSFRFSGKRF